MFCFARFNPLKNTAVGNIHENYGNPEHLQMFLNIMYINNQPKASNIYSLVHYFHITLTNSPPNQLFFAAVKTVGFNSRKICGEKNRIERDIKPLKVKWQKKIWKSRRIRRGWDVKRHGWQRVFDKNSTL